ncbi:MAG: enoyl-CoA hydratase/isomerase family protein [Spirochaetota bacterium]
MDNSNNGKKCYYETDDNGVALMTIDNPPMNALSPAVLADMKDSIENALENDAVRVIIITGAGKAFVAGADITEIQKQKTEKEGADFLVTGQELYNLIENAHKPFIAAINGYCLGGGLELALACHMRLADEKAQLGLPEIKLGIIPGYGGTQRSPRIFGKSRAFELILSGNFINAKRAEMYGVINRATEPGSVLTEAKDLADSIASRGRLAVQAAMRAISGGIHMEMREALTFEREEFGKLCETADKEEGIDAFLNKREPKIHDR